MNNAAILAAVADQITSGLVAPGASALGRLANALKVASRDDTRGMMMLRARIGERNDIAMSISVDIAPGVARIALFIPSSVANTHGSLISGAIMHIGDYRKYPATINDEAFSCEIKGGIMDLAAEDNAEIDKAVAQRLLFEIRSLWLTTAQSMVNVGLLGKRSAITVFSNEPLLSEEISAQCGGAPVAIVQADTAPDDTRIVSFVEGYCDDQTLLRCLSSISGVEVVGSHHPITAMV